MDKWYSPDSFSFKYDQIVWLLSWLPYIRRENLDWPPGGRNSSYHNTMPPATKYPSFWDRMKRRLYVKPTFTYRPTWEHQRGTIGQLEIELCHRGLRGIMCVMMYSLGYSADMIGRYMGCSGKKVVETVHETIKEIEVSIRSRRKLDR